MNKISKETTLSGLVLESFACKIWDRQFHFFPNFFNKPKQVKALIIIDAAVNDFQTLARGVKAGTEVFIINSFQEGVAQISNILATQQEIDSLQIVAHGAAGTIELGTTELNLENLATYSQLITKWKNALNQQADILLVSCQTAAGETGEFFVRELSRLTGANVAASRTLTGSSIKGGDWDLEVTSGPIQSSLAFHKEALESYSFVLATLVNESFKGSEVLGPWIYGVSGASANPGLTAGTGSGTLPGLPVGDPVGSGALRLTSNATNQAAFVIYDSPISATSGLEFTFDFFAYNGAGLGPGDGLSFFLINGLATPTQAGGFDSSLGYSRNTDSNTPGIEGGYVGIGFDEYGNFARAFQKGPPGSDPTPVAGVNGYAAEPAAQVPDTVTLRGRESSTSSGTGYNYIAHTSVATQGGIDNYTATTRDSAKRSVLVRLEPSPSNRLTVSIDFNNNGVYTDANETVIDIPNITTLNGPVPSTFKFGFASSTGGGTNIHEVQNLAVKTIDPSPTQADVVTGKTGPASITAGQPISYTITTQNNGPSAATNVAIADTLPPGLTGVTVSHGGTYDPATGKVTFPAIATLNAGAANAVTRTISFPVPANVSSIVNTVSSTSDTPDPTPNNNDGTTDGSSTTPGGKITTTVNPSADVVTGKVGPASITAGQPISYTITTQNNGPSAATNVAIADTLPPGLTGVAVSHGGTYDPATGKVAFPAIATLNAGAANAVTRTISFPVPGNVSSIVNTVSSTSDTPDPTPNNNNGTTDGSSTTPGGKITTAVNPSADVVTTNTGPTTATAGTPITYTVTAKNNGPSVANQVIVTNSLPTGLNGVTVPNGGSYNPTTGIITFPTLDSLSSGESISNTFTVIVPNSGSISSTAKSTSSTPDPNPSNNNGTAANATVTTSSTPNPIVTPIGNPGLIITQPLGTTDVLESLGSDLYKVRLNSQPTANVTVAIQADSRTTLDKNSLTFTPTNWNVNQTVTVKAVNDAIVQGNQIGTLSHATTSTDPLYQNLAKSLTVNLSDDDNLGTVNTFAQRAIVALTNKDDRVIGSTFEDIIQARAGNDYLEGQGKDDYLNGQKGTDGISGGDGNDIIFGGQENDFLQGDSGNDLIYGGKDKDRIWGGNGNDLLFGSTGNDYLSGDLGIDTLTGGVGNDVFAMAIGSGGNTLATADIITDFNLNEDRLDLISPLNFNQLNISQGTGININDTIIQYQPTGEYLAVLKGVNALSIVLGLTL